ncbi:hypothetical protein HK405_000370, partial [Cladochytrium tenue]
MPSLTVGTVTVATLAIAAPLVAAVILTLRARRHKISPAIPRPDGWLPVLGHSLLFLGGNQAAISTFEKFGMELGPLYVVELGAGRETLCVADVDIIAQLYRRRHTDTCAERAFRASHESLDLGHTVSLEENYDQWKALRKIIEPPFTPSNVKKMVPYILRAAKGLVSGFANIAEMQAAETADHPRPGEFTGKAVVDLNPVVRKATFDFMMLYSFDLDDNKYSKQLSLEDVERTSHGIIDRLMSVFKLHRFYLTAHERKTQDAAKRVRETSFNIIDEARKRVEAGDASDIREHS